MRRKFFIVLSIVLMFFAFSSCSNDNGRPGFNGDSQQVAKDLDIVTLVNDVLKAGSGDDVDIDYKLIPQTTENTKAIAAGTYTLQITVTFKAYETAAGTITGGVLVYEIPGSVNNNTFTASGRGSSITTTEDLVVETEDGDATVTIKDEKPAITNVKVTIAADDSITSVTASVTVSSDVSATVDGEDVTIPSKPEDDDQPVVDPSTPYDVATADAFTEMLQEEGQVRLTSNITVTTLDFGSEKTSFIIDLNSHTLTIDSSKSITLPTVTIKNGSLVTTMEPPAGDDWGSTCSFRLDAGSIVTIDNVTYTASTSGFALGTNEYSSTNAKIIVKNSDITAKGVYGISTNAKTNEEGVLITETVTIEISDGSNITAESRKDGDSCAVLMNIPGELTITGSTIKGDRQGVFIRGGSATITDSSIISTGKYGTECSAPVYFDDSYWKTGSDAPFAALLVGNRNNNSDTPYGYAASCTLDNATIDMQGTDEHSYDIYVYRNSDNYEVSVSGSVTNEEPKVNDASTRNDATYTVAAKSDEEVENPVTDKPELKGTLAGFVEYVNNPDGSMDENTAAGWLWSTVVNIAANSGSIEADKTYTFEGEQLQTADYYAAFWGDVAFKGPIDSESGPSGVDIDGRLAIYDNFVFDIQGANENIGSTCTIKINNTSYTFDPNNLG